jgi:iron complex outermembrane recepter protein
MTKFRYGFLRSISLSALVAGSAFAADTKPATTAASPAALEEVVVTGIRASLQSAMDAKRDAIQIIDAISAEDIGKFPDKNLGEALQRVTGVQISRSDGEGRNVTVRGSEASQIRVEINGSTALSVSPNAGDRAVDFRDLPVEFVSRLEVVKSPTADMTEGGISTIRVITRRPFDSTEPFLAGSAQGAYSNLAEKTDPKVALIGSRLFMDNTLGILVSAQYEKRHLNDNTANTTGWLRFASTSTPTTPVCNASTAQGARRNDFNSDGICDWYPQIPRYINNRRITDRGAFSSVVEWRPSNDFKLYWDTTYARGKEDVDNTLLQLNASGGVFDYTKTTVGADNTVSHIELTSNSNNAGGLPLDLSYRNILGSLTRTQYVTALGAKWDVGSQVTLDGRFDYSNAKVFNNETDSTAQLFGVPRAAIDYTGSEGAPNITFPGLNVTSPAGINRLDSVHVPVRDDSDDKQGTFNVTYQPSNVGWLKLKAGVQRHEYKVTQDQYSKTIRLNCIGDTSSGSIIAVSVPCATITGIIANNSTINPIAFYKTGDLGFSNGTRYWNDNTDATVAAQLAAAGQDLNVYAFNPNTKTNNTFRAYTSNWSVSEKTNSWYGQAEFAFPDLHMPVSGTVGLRHIDTKTNSTGYTQQTAGAVVTFPITSIDGSYTQTLPSMNLKVGLIPDTLIARFAAAKVMARPAPSQLALAQRTDIVGLTDIRGNPGLLPFLSTDYDAGIEWYFSRTSYLSAAYFRKEISRFILQTTRPEVIDGVPYSLTAPINGTDKVTVDGLELGFQYAFDFLPAPLNGFGVLANYTYQKDKGFTGVNQIDGSALSFPGLSRNSYNFSLYYENSKFDARLSYNWRSRWLINASGRGNLPEFNDAYGQLDAEAGYNITSHVSLFLDATNLTDQQLVQENAPGRPIQLETFGKRYFAGVRAKF